MQLPEEMWGPPLAAALMMWRRSVFDPAIEKKRAGTYRGATLGAPFAPVPVGSGASLSRRHSGPVLLAERPAIYESVEEFDHTSERYEEVVRVFSDPIFEEATALLGPHLTPNSRILDPSCGPGQMAIDLASALPGGEVVAADLSEGMVKEAHRKALEAGQSNMAFFQADVGNPPSEFLGYFDAVFSCLSFHHYPDGRAAAKTFRKVLRPGGVAIIADAGPAWFKLIARGISVATDPGFVQHRSGHEFRALLLQSGFREFFWVEALPGIGLTLARA